MDVQQMLDNKKDLQYNILEFLDDNDENNELIINFLDLKKINESPSEIKELLHLILKISKYHYRNTGFRDKIAQIIIHYKNEIMQFFTNFEIFNFFKHDKQILLILFENGILVADSTIAAMTKSFKSYRIFFYPELKPFLQKDDQKSLKIDPDFEQKRRKGENDSYICELIRDDLIDEFVTYVNQKSISLHNTLIQPSIFETNCLIQDKKLTFIEYAAFYGSIQIFNFLRLNEVLLTPSLWTYSIHGKNPEIIHLLEEYKVDMDINKKRDFTNILITSVKCHHDDITKYIIDNIIMKYQKIYNVHYSFDNNVVTYCIRYYNYEFMPDNLTDSFIIYNLCKYGHTSFVKLLFEKRLMKLKLKKILEFRYFNRVSKIDLFFFNAVSYQYIFLNEISNQLFFVILFSLILLFLYCFAFIVLNNTSIFHAAENNNQDIVQFLMESYLDKIDDDLFKNAKKLVRIIMQSSIKSIGKSAFESCVSLREIIMPSFVISIEENSFKRCVSLREIVIPSSVLSIRKSAFENCFSLEEIMIPSSVKYIDDYAFRMCKSLSKITFEDQSSLEKIGYKTFECCISLKEIIIPPTVTEIKQQAFSECSSMVNVSFPASITELGLDVLEGCRSIKQITIPVSCVKYLNIKSDIKIIAI